MPMTLPPDAKTDYRAAVDLWDRLWKAHYRTDQEIQTGDKPTAPGYTRGWGRTIAGLFQRQPPVTSSEDTTPAALPGILTETIHKATAYGSVLLRPVYDGDMWKTSVVKPTRFVVEWAERRPTMVQVWDTAPDPRDPDNERTGLAIIETWTPDPDDPDAPGTISTEVWTTSVDGMNGRVLDQQVSTENPGTALEDHPYIVSAQNDTIARRMVPFVWEWDDLGPVPIWYTLEQTLIGLARLWDQEQDDAELTRKRIAMPEDSIGKTTIYAEDGSTLIARPGFQKSDNVLALSAQMSAQHGPTGGVQAIEFGDDLVQNERITSRENSALENAGINPASIGRNVSGRSDSGEAKRADNQQTMNTISGPARNVEEALTLAVGDIARLNSEPWGTDDRVAVREGLKENPLESAEVARALRDADAASTLTLVATAHPTWDEDQVEAEVTRMQAENRSASFIE